MENNKHLRAAFRCPWRIVNNPPDQWAFFDAHSITYITPKISRQRSDFETFLKRERNWPRLRWCWPAWEIPYPMGAGGLPVGKWVVCTNTANKQGTMVDKYFSNSASLVVKIHTVHQIILPALAISFYFSVGWIAVPSSDRILKIACLPLQSHKESQKRVGSTKVP